jgi:transposase-like protein
MPDVTSIRDVAEELGIGISSLERWIQEHRKGAFVPKKKKSKPSRPQDRSAEEKLRLVMEASEFDDAQLGAFLRREGIHESNLRQWRQAVLDVLQPKGESSIQRDRNQIRALQKELRRKDRALAEAGALLVLQKKVRALWGEEDDDTKLESD